MEVDVKKEVLIIGESGSIWIKKFITNYMDPSLFEISVLSYNDNDISWYINRNIRIIQLEKIMQTKYNKSKFYKYIGIKALEEKLFQFNIDFDYILVQYVRLDSIKIADYYKRRKKTKIFWIYWGSDLLRKPRKRIMREKKYLKNADGLIVGANSLKERIEQVYSYEISSKLFFIEFGMGEGDVIEEMKKNYYTKESARDELELPLDKIIITIGYNGSPQQNHILVIQALNELDNVNKNKILLLLPVSYGLDNDYLEQLTDELEEGQWAYRLFTEFMDSQQVIPLRYATDIFIHAQTTDAMSATILEYLYTNTLVFNPRRIRYKELTDRYIEYVEYLEEAELSKLVERAISEEAWLKVHNTEKLLELPSADDIKKQWMGIINAN